MDRIYFLSKVSSYCCKMSARYFFLEFFIVLVLLFEVNSQRSFHEVVTFVGRFQSDSEGANWPYSGIKFNFLSRNETAVVSVDFKNCSDSCNFFVEVQVSCKTVSTFHVTPTSTTLKVNVSSDVGNHFEFMLRKLTEASNGDATGIMEIGEVSLVGADFVAPSRDDNESSTRSSCLHKHKMIVFGDSITCAYGVDGVSPCSFSADTENVHHGYAALIADAVQAELNVVAWSGKGVVRNYGDINQMSSEPLPSYYNRTIATKPIPLSTQDANYWNPANFPADLVLVMLGTNDYSTEPVPSDEMFVDGLVNFLARIRKDYPAADKGGKIAALCAPIASGNQCQNIRYASTVADVAFLLVDPSTLDGGYGCDGHPNAVSQQLMADFILPFVQTLLNR
jgi:lysophospholipase L1-like esterase